MYTCYTHTYINIILYKYKISRQDFIYNEEAPCTSHTSCAKVTILLLEDLSTLLVTDIYVIYFRLSVKCS